MLVVPRITLTRSPCDVIVIHDHSRFKCFLNGDDSNCNEEEEEKFVIYSNGKDEMFYNKKSHHEARET
jgi:uncharacterized protein (UPF0548 family)